MTARRTPERHTPGAEAAITAELTRCVLTGAPRQELRYSEFEEWIIDLRAQMRPAMDRLRAAILRSLPGINEAV